MKRLISVFSVSLLVAAVSGCNPYNNTGEGAAVGGSVGALAGGIIGHQSHEGVEGALIGGALGAVTGAVVGSTVQKTPPPAPVVVVAQPAPVIVTPVQSPDLTVNVPNSDGTYTAVVLRRSGYGYVGPQGEYYPQMPSVDQLRAMYGR